MPGGDGLEEEFGRHFAVNDKEMQVPSMTVRNFEELVNEKKHWDECGAKLQAILSEIASRIGDAPLYVDENGKFFVHPEVVQKLDEPGNEELREFLLFMQRMNGTN